MNLSRKFNSLQVLRALAALAVLVHHTVIVEHKYTHFEWLSVFLKNGLYGVDLFFVISGFIITYTALRHVGQKGAGLEFLKHRALRIYPAYWEFTALVLAVYLVKPEWINASAHAAPDILGSFLLTVPEECLLNAVGWTLTFEVYFYLVFSLIFIFGRKFLPLLWALWAGYVIGLTALNYPLLRDNFFFHVTASPQVLEFVLGSMAGVWMLKHPPQPRLAVPALIIAIAWAAAAYAYLQSLPLDIGRTLLCAVPCMLTVFAAVNAEGFFQNRLWRPLVLVGNSSYSLYLSHVLVIAALGRLSADLLPKLDALSYALWLAVCWGIAIAVGMVNYRLAEKPILRLLRRKPAAV